MRLPWCMNPTPVTDYMPSPKSQLVDQIGQAVFRELKEKTKLCPCECGGRMMHEITLLHLGFHYYNEIEIDKARELLMAAGTLFLKKINENEQIRPYLAYYPFLPEDIEIRIFLKKSSGLKIDSKKLQVATLIDGILNYEIDDAKCQLFEIIYSETFEEAEQKLREAKAVNFFHMERKIFLS